MKSILHKIFEDTLKSPDGDKFSRKSLTMFVAFVNLLALSWLEVLTSVPLLKDCCQLVIPDHITNIFVLLTFGQSALTVLDKKKNG